MKANPGLEPAAGTYVLWLQASKKCTLQIGSLGQISLSPGWYAYVGSAFGPGGVAARVAHHRRTLSRCHWHIDYLRKGADLHALWYSYDPKHREHLWAGCLAQELKGFCPFPGFGATDCNCSAHLFAFNEIPSKIRFSRQLKRQVPEHAPILSHFFADEG